MNINQFGGTGGSFFFFVFLYVFSMKSFNLGVLGMFCFGDYCDRHQDDKI